MMEEALASERPRIVRLCARFTRDGQQAEDLAQEVLSRAWRYRDRRDPHRPVRPYLDAIARNVCRTYLARRRESLPLTSAEALSVTEDPLAHLERADLLALLQEALDTLPETTRAALLARYLDQASIGEIARRLETTDEAVHTRLHRGKQTLKRLFESDGQFPHTVPVTETVLWCTRCGRNKLRGGIYTSPEGIRLLELRCPSCFRIAQSRYIRGRGEEYLGGLCTLRPVVKRTMRVAHGFWRDALRRGSGRCQKCSRMAPLRVGSAPGLKPDAQALSPQALRPALILSCPCGTCRWQWADDLVLTLPAVQRLWGRYPRLRQVFPAPNRVRFEALTCRASVEVLTDPHTFEPLEILTRGIPTP